MNLIAKIAVICYNVNMEYDKFIENLSNYGIDKDSIITREGLADIQENVVIAPAWRHDIFAEHVDTIDQVSDRVYNIRVNGACFSFIEVNNIGAPRMLDIVLSLKSTRCKNIVQIGSVGSITNNINIGDIVIVKESINGVGATRYLNDNLTSDFEERYIPNQELTDRLKDSTKKYISTSKIHDLVVYCVDTILGQFPHINHYLSMGAQALEMETSTLFKCADMVGIKATSLLCVSDNSVACKSLYGRTQEEKANKHYTQEQIIPKIIIDLFS